MKYLFLIIIAGLWPAPAQASKDDALKYRKCMALVDSKPQAAVNYANDWIYGHAGGVPAGHCKALGLLGLDRVKDAARLLEKLVDDMVISGAAKPATLQKNTHLKVQLYAQAALAWKEAGDFDKSYMAYSSALSGIGKDKDSFNGTLLYELYLERGTLQILRGQFKAATEDFTLAIEKNARPFEGFLQRAKAYRKSRAFLKARLDLRIASKIAPDHPGILLESGILAREMGEKPEARLAWQKIMELYPESDYAPLARTNIDLLKSQL